MTEEQKLICLHFVQAVVEAIPVSGAAVRKAVDNLVAWTELEFEIEYYRGFEDGLSTPGGDSGPGLIIGPDGQLKDE